jgi:hypothetical protein
MLIMFTKLHGVTYQKTVAFTMINLRVPVILEDFLISSGSLLIVTEEWRLRNEELNDLYSPPNIIRVIKSRRMRCAGHIARMGKREVHTGFWWGGLREGDHLGYPGVDGRIILKWIFKMWDGAMGWIELAQDRGRWRAVVNAVMNLRVP